MTTPIIGAPPRPVSLGVLGLTHRSYIATHLLGALIQTSTGPLELLPAQAIWLADKLLEELQKPAKKGDSE